MVIQNLETKKQYSMPRESYEKLGKNKALFKVIDERDEADLKPQIIDNTAKPGTGQSVIIKGDNKNKQTKETKK